MAVHRLACALPASSASGLTASVVAGSFRARCWWFVVGALAHRNRSRLLVPNGSNLSAGQKQHRHRPPRGETGYLAGGADDFLAVIAAASPSRLRSDGQVFGRPIAASAWAWVRWWWAVPLPGVQRGRCRTVCRTPAAVAGVHIAGRSRAIGVRKPRRCPHVRTVGVRRPRRPVLVDQRRRAGPVRAAAHPGLGWRLRGPRSPAAASRRSPPRTSRPVGVRVAAEPDTRPRPLSASASGTAPGVRTAAGDRGHCGQGYRNSSPGRRPLVGRRHCRDVWPTWRASRSRNPARAKAMAGRSKARASSAVNPP
jgi:hypothetical protein